MTSMFEGCSSLTSIDVTGLNTSKAYNVGGMFAECNKLSKIDLSSFDLLHAHFIIWLLTYRNNANTTLVQLSEVITPKSMINEDNSPIHLPYDDFYEYNNGVYGDVAYSEIPATWTESKVLKRKTDGSGNEPSSGTGTNTGGTSENQSGTDSGGSGESNQSTNTSGNASTMTEASATIQNETSTNSGSSSSTGTVNSGSATTTNNATNGTTAAITQGQSKKLPSMDQRTDQSNGGSIYAEITNAPEGASFVIRDSDGSTISGKLKLASGQLMTPYNLILQDANGNEIHTGFGTCTVILPVPGNMDTTKGKIQVVTINTDGTVEKLNTSILTVAGIPCVTFSTTHFSEYALIYTPDNVQMADPNNGVITQQPVQQVNQTENHTIENNANDMPKTGISNEVQHLIAIILFLIGAIIILSNYKIKSVRS